MKKISFDVEDHPPPSYYKESDSVQIGQFADCVKSQPSISSIDKSEWWKTPEFVPKSQQMVELPSVHQVQHDKSARFVVHHPAIPDQHVDKQEQQQQHPHYQHQHHHHQQQQQQQQLIANNVRNAQHFQPSGFTPIPMPPLMTNPNLMRPYPPPPPMFPLPPGMTRPFLPPVPLLPQAFQQFSQFQRQPMAFRTPRQPPRSMIMSSNGIPSGYTANMTTINAGLGAQIPAIVIKKKRKKKTKKLKEINQFEMTDNDKTEPLASEQKSKESSPDDKSSTPTSTLETGRSEPDLMALHNKSGGIGSNFPADLDLIQSTANCAMLTGSWPDLSEPQKQMLHNEGLYNVYFDEEDQLEDAENSDLHDHDDVEQDEAALPEFVKQWEDDDLPENQTLISKDKRQQPFYAEDSRKVLVRSTGDGTSTTELLPKDSFETFKRPFRSFSLPDVPLVSGDRSRVCCSIM